MSAEGTDRCGYSLSSLLLSNLVQPLEKLLLALQDPCDQKAMQASGSSEEVKGAGICFATVDALASFEAE